MPVRSGELASALRRCIPELTPAEAAKDAASAIGLLTAQAADGKPFRAADEALLQVLGDLGLARLVPVGEAPRGLKGLFRRQPHRWELDEAAILGRSR